MEPYETDLHANARYRLETPEQIELEYDLAGPGSRFCALFIDALLMWLVAITLVLILFAANVDLFDTDFGGGLAGWVTALLIVLLAFLFTSGYYIVFEMAMRGQTPGKRALGIRVLREDGTHITLQDCLIRNLLRIVDFLPGMYGLGGVMSMYHPLHKRLGDLAAGTLVVKEAVPDYRARTDSNYRIDEGPDAEPFAELTTDERRLIVGFLRRRNELMPRARAALAERIGTPLYHKYGGDVADTDAETYLQRLYEGTHHAL